MTLATSTQRRSACCPQDSIMFFFFNNTATTEIYTLSLHDAFRSQWMRQAGSLPTIAWISSPSRKALWGDSSRWPLRSDRKSTRLNSSHSSISYAVFCLKKKKKNIPKKIYQLNKHTYSQLIIVYIH